MLILIFYKNNPEIEEFGLTPYKAEVIKCKTRGVSWVKTSEQTVRDLINSSYIPQNIFLANPILDLACIVGMAYQTEILELFNHREELIYKLLNLIKEII